MRRRIYLVLADLDEMGEGGERLEAALEAGDQPDVGMRDLRYIPHSFGPGQIRAGLDIEPARELLDFAHAEATNLAGRLQARFADLVGAIARLGTLAKFLLVAISDDPQCSICRRRHPSDDRHPCEQEADKSMPLHYWAPDGELMVYDLSEDDLEDLWDRWSRGHFDDDDEVLDQLALEIEEAVQRKKAREAFEITNAGIEPSFKYLIGK